MSTFLVESNDNGDYDFSNSTTKVWSLEDILSEINRDHSECWKPYNEEDWEQGWDEWCTDYHRIIKVKAWSHVHIVHGNQEKQGRKDE